MDRKVGVNISWRHSCDWGSSAFAELPTTLLRRRGRRRRHVAEHHHAAEAHTALRGICHAGLGRVRTRGHGRARGVDVFEGVTFERSADIATTTRATIGLAGDRGAQIQRAELVDIGTGFGVGAFGHCAGEPFTEGSASNISADHLAPAAAHASADTGRGSRGGGGFGGKRRDGTEGGDGSSGDEGKLLQVVDDLHVHSPVCR
jgi:hypothetical protein